MISRKSMYLAATAVLIGILPLRTISAAGLTVEMGSVSVAVTEIAPKTCTAVEKIKVGETLVEPCQYWLDLYSYWSYWRDIHTVEIAHYAEQRDLCYQRPEYAMDPTFCQYWEAAYLTAQANLYNAEWNMILALAGASQDCNPGGGGGTGEARGGRPEEELLDD